MTLENVSLSQIRDRLLSEEERVACQSIAQSDEALPKQRATALLAFDAGSTRAEAAEQSGLTLGQVRYLLATFRQKRLGMFTEEFLMEMEAQPQTEYNVQETVEEGVDEFKIEKAPGTKETKKRKRKEQKKEKKVKAKGKKIKKKDKKLKKLEISEAKGKKGKGEKGKAKGGKKGKGKGKKKKTKK